MTKKVLGVFIFWKTMVLFFAYAATLTFPFDNAYGPKFFIPVLPYYLSIWANFDGIRYLTIARDGYYNFLYPFFPLFPLLIRLLHVKFQMPHVLAGQIVSNTAFLLSLFVILKLLKQDGLSRLSDLSLILIIIFPSSFFYGAIYNDSLFLLLATLSILFARRKQWILASVWGALATLTRLNGLTLFFLIYLEFLSSGRSIAETWKVKNYLQLKYILPLKKIVSEKVYVIFLIPAAFAGYLAYVQLFYSDWSQVFSSMKIWNQDKVVFPLQVFWRYIKIVIIYPTFKLNYWVAVFELSAVLVYIFFLCYAYKKIRFSYWIFFAMSILIPSLTGTFQGMPRYGLHLYPFFLSMAIFFEKRSRSTMLLYFAACISLLLLFVSLFTRGNFIA